MNTAEIARLVGYFATVGLGIYMTVVGVQRGDATLTTSGVALVTVGGTAGGVLARQTAQHGR